MFNLHHHLLRLRRAGVLAAVAAACAAAAPAAGAATTQLDAGDTALCAIADGRVTCHGLDASSVAHVQDFTQVAVGLSHACGLRAAGEVLCWSEQGQSAAFPPPGEFAAIGAGWSVSCGLDPAGGAACWGDDAGYGELYPPLGSGQLHGLSVGEFHSCALDASGEAVCWGANVNGQRSPDPGAFAAVSAGGGHTCGLRPSGGVACWGLDNAGQAQDQAPPAGERFVSVSAGSLSTCAITDTGRVVCWGANGSGESTAPGGSFSAVSVGRGYACGLRSTGALECWGEAPLPAHEYNVAFHAPVDAPPTVNTGRAGRVIPVKVEVLDRGQEVRAGRVTVEVVPSAECATARADALEAFAPSSSTAAGELGWDASADRWTTQLDTSGLTAPGCHRVQIAVDGTVAGHFVLKLRR